MIFLLVALLPFMWHGRGGAGGELQHSGTLLGTLGWPVPVCGTRVASSHRLRFPLGALPSRNCVWSPARLPRDQQRQPVLGFVVVPTPGAAPAEPRGCHCPLHQPGRAQRELPASGLREKTASVCVVCYINQGKTWFEGTGEGDSLAERLRECLSQHQEELGRNFCFMQARNLPVEKRQTAEHWLLREQTHVREAGVFLHALLCKNKVNNSCNPSNKMEKSMRIRRNSALSELPMRAGCTGGGNPFRSQRRQSQE